MDCVNERAVAVIVDYLRDKFPKQKFFSKTVQTGSAIWDTTVTAGEKRILYFVKRGYVSGLNGISYEVMFYPENIIGYSNKISRTKNADITLREVKKGIDEVIKLSPIMVKSWKTKGLNDEHLKSLDMAYAKACEVFKSFFKGVDKSKLLQHGNNFCATGEGVRTMFFEGTDDNIDVLKCGYFNVNSGYQTTRIEIFKTVFRPATFSQMIKFLNNIEPLLKKAVKELPKDFADMATGKIDENKVVKSISKVSSELSSCDEWLMTDVIVEIKMATKEKVNKEIFVQWLKKNWNEVIAKSPDIKKSWKTESCSNCCDDTPQYGLSWCNPKNMTFRDIENVYVEQNIENKTAKIYYHTSVR